jgi:NADH:ubiquinone oxidoreductase subunit 6 (subunit J)
MTITCLFLIYSILIIIIIETKQQQQQRTTKIREREKKIKALISFIYGLYFHFIIFCSCSFILFFRRCIK